MRGKKKTCINIEVFFHQSFPLTVLVQSALTDCLASVRAANPPTTAQYPKKTVTRGKKTKKQNQPEISTIYIMPLSFMGPIKVACSLNCLLLILEVNKFQAPFLLDCLKEKAPKAKTRGASHSNYDARSTTELVVKNNKFCILFPCLHYLQ